MNPFKMSKVSFLQLAFLLLVIEVSKISSEEAVEHVSDFPSYTVVGTFARSNLVGVASYGNKLFAIDSQSSLLSIYSEYPTYDDLEKVEIKDNGIVLQNAWDMVASTGLVFICEYSTSAIWIYDISSRKIRRTVLNGKPHRMSVSATGDLLVLMWMKADEDEAAEAGKLTSSTLNVYRIQNGNLVRKEGTKLDVEIFSRAYHAVEVSKSRYLILHSKGDPIEHQDADETLTRLLDGKPTQVNIYFGEYRMTEIYTQDNTVTSNMTYTDVDFNWPRHMAIDSKQRIYIADYRSDRLVFKHLSKDGGWSQIAVEKPLRVLYLEDKRQLIVGQSNHVIIYQEFVQREEL